MRCRITAAGFDADEFGFRSPLDSRFIRGYGQEVKLEAVATLGKGHIYDSLLTEFSQEGYLLQHYHGFFHRRPRDAFSLKIQSIWQLSDGPQELLFRSTCHAAEGIAKMDIGCQMCFPYVARTAAWQVQRAGEGRLHDGVQALSNLVQQIAEDAGSQHHIDTDNMLVLLLPEPIMKLALKGLWTELVYCAKHLRWVRNHFKYQRRLGLPISDAGFLDRWPDGD